MRGKVALVTGVSRKAGIGAAIALELASAGASVFLSHFRRYDQDQLWAVAEDEPEQILQSLRAGSGDVESLEIDLADSDSPRVLMDAVRSRFGRLDILVNNAAHSETGGIEQLDARQLDRHYAVNLRAPALLCVELARRHEEGRSARIVNITSGQGLGPMPSELAYAATKGGLDALTLSMSPALAPLGITINAVDPGATDTGWMSADFKQFLERGAPMNRVGLPSDLVPLVRFLASEESGWITGQLIRSRGGS
jgi:3-oxoacyl-[acyl-carrier protein] reductase